MSFFEEFFCYSVFWDLDRVTPTDCPPKSCPMGNDRFMGALYVNRLWVEGGDGF